ncbi:MAG: hypothetical protein IMY72_05350 [Bacteroidetes bacterium]|nr:hypothetical protein [Bacteroidota bacterium]
MVTNFRKNINKDKKKCLFIILLLFVWFSLDMTGFSFANITLVESAWNQVDGLWWLIFLTLFILFIFKEKFGKYLLSIFILMWIIIQFNCHWYHTIFGTSVEKINSYNQYFRNTLHVISSSEKILIPDLYHIILHLLILISLIILIRYIIYSLIKKNKKL